VTSKFPDSIAEDGNHTIGAGNNRDIPLDEGAISGKALVASRKLVILIRVLQERDLRMCQEEGLRNTVAKTTSEGTSATKMALA
jgi:hypothetical protein